MTAKAGTASISDHMAVVRAKLGTKVAPDPELPHAARHVWNIFIDLSRTRPAGGFGISGIPYSEVEAYCRLSGITLDPWEVRGIRALDDAYIEQAAREMQSEKGNVNG